jgi:uncharacterized protein (TIGR03083 family)
MACGFAVAARFKGSAGSRHFSRARDRLDDEHRLHHWIDETLVGHTTSVSRPAVTIAEYYRQGRLRQLALAAMIDDAAAARRVPTCPLWSVKDVYAHQAGVASDILAGNLEGVATDEWTARQVAERAERSFAEVVAELETRGAELDPLLEAAVDDVDRRLVIDQWTHEQDVRHALDAPGSRDVPLVSSAVDTILRAHTRRWPKTGLPAVRVAGSAKSWLLGAGTPVATWRADDFELLRSLLGRRSRAQVLAQWDGNGERFVDQFVAFRFAAHDIYE